MKNNVREKERERERRGKKGMGIKAPASSSMADVVMVRIPRGETVKNADDKEGVVIRLFEAFKETKTVALQVDKKFQKAYICDMLEREEMELSLQDGKLEFPIKPFEIITVKLK